jgi:hyperosmotically inducible protein
MKRTLKGTASVGALAAMAALAMGCARNDPQMQPVVPSTDTTSDGTYGGATNTMPTTPAHPAVSPIPAPATNAPASAPTPTTTPTKPSGVSTPPAPATATRDAHAKPNDPNADRAAAPATDANVRADADNTRVNARDRSSASPTPMDQSNSKDDIRITADIRRGVVGDGSLSFTAKNVKIITSGGKVVLRGPVKTAQERATIEAKARATAGVTDVDNQLEVKP